MRRTPVPFDLRRATSADLDVLTRHRRGMWRGIGRHTTRQLDEADPVYRAWLSRMFRARRAVAWIAVGPRSRAIGSGVLWLPEAQPRPGELRVPRPYLMSMYTAPAARGNGVASAIVAAAVDWSRERGYRRVTLHASDMGRSVYERLRFQAGREMVLTLRPGRRPSTGDRRASSEPKPLSRSRR